MTTGFALTLRGDGMGIKRFENLFAPFKVRRRWYRVTTEDGGPIHRCQLCGEQVPAKMPHLQHPQEIWIHRHLTCQRFRHFLFLLNALIYIMVAFIACFTVFCIGFLLVAYFGALYNG